MSSAESTPTVFVVYGHDSQEHAQRVLALADRLRKWGLDARLDQYIDDPPEGWPRWIQRQLVECDFVLIVCTPTARGQVEREPTGGVGSGGPWEGKIVEQLIYEAQARNEKLVPVLFEEGTDQDVPMALRASSRYRLPEDYDALFQRLTRARAGSLQLMSESWAERIAAARNTSEFEAREGTDRPWLLEPQSDVGLDDHLWDTCAAASLDVLARTVPATTSGSTIVVGGRVRYKQRPVPRCPDCDGMLQPTSVSIRFELAPAASAVQSVAGYRCACGSEWPDPFAMRAAHAAAFGSTIPRHP
jgi:hypothetical protein